MTRKNGWAWGWLAALAVGIGPAWAADPFTLTVHDHRFDVTEVKVPANRKVVLTLRNDDQTAEEFAIGELKITKVMGPVASVALPIGPLKPGRYAFVGLFHEETAKGTIVVTDAAGKE